jgi:hypothetical protein
VCVCVCECVCVGGEGGGWAGAGVRACLWHVWVGGYVGKCVRVFVPVWACESEGVNVDRRLRTNVTASASVSASARERGREGERETKKLSPALRNTFA